MEDRNDMLDSGYYSGREPDFEKERKRFDKHIDNAAATRRELARRQITRVLRQYTEGMTSGQIYACIDAVVQYGDFVATLEEMRIEGTVLYNNGWYKIPRRGLWATLRSLFGY